jgi:hypothetical protein
VVLIDQAQFGPPPYTAPPTALTMARNQISTVTTGVADDGARGPVTLNDDLIFDTDFTAIQTSGRADSVAAISVVNSTIVANDNIGISLQDSHLDLDSSLLDQGIFLYGPPSYGLSTCTIGFSRGPATGTPGDLTDCNDFQTTAAPSFANAGTGDYHLTAAGNAAFIDQGNPAAPVAPNDFDIDGDPRAIDHDPVCPRVPVRDIGADEIDFAHTCRTLTVLLAGSGQGRVTGPGIDCPGDCTEVVDDGAMLSLTAATASGSAFSGWNSPCTTAPVCDVVMGTDRNLTATFALPPGTTQGGGGVAAGTGGATGQRAAALKRCKRKKGKARRRCKKNALKLPA